MSGLRRIISLVREDRRIRRREWRSLDEDRPRVRARLKAILSAAERVPYYRALFAEAGVGAGAIDTVDALRSIPVTTNHTLRELPREQVVVPGADFSTLLDKWSSGSTGITMHTYLTRYERDVQALYALRAFRAGGYRASDKLLDLLEPYAPSRRPMERLGLYRKHYVPLKEDLGDHLPAIERLQPDVILTSSTLLDLLCDRLTERGVRLRPRLVYNTGERISARQRARSREILGTDPVDVYGATEFGPIAFQCAERAGYHINTDGLVVEIVDPATGAPVADGEVGQVVITGLIGEVMPFVRYSVGDLARRSGERCACGRSLPLLDSVEGRLIEMLLDGKGRPISPWGPTIVLEETPNVDRYQLVQDAIGRLTIKIEGGPVDEADVTEQLRALLGADLETSFEYPESIDHDGRHKFRLVINRASRS